jgi:hypothetical protein
MDSGMINMNKKRISLMDNLRIVFSDFKELMPPSIIVIGEQSSGKSSVLESLSGGIKFATGDDTVTRCPLQLSMKNNPDMSNIKASIQIKLDNETKSICINDAINNGDEIVNTVIKYTSYARGDKSISHKLIEILVEGPELSDLTLIDLPGLVQKSPDDEPDLKDDIYKLVSDYIKNPDNIIIIVADGNRDLQTIVGINEAQEYDKQLERTICVLTKIDKELTNDGVETDKKIESFTKKLNGEGKIKLPLGFVAVRNRIGADGNDSYKLIRKREENIMNKLPNVKQECKGIPALINKLVYIQGKRLEDIIPEQEAKLISEKHKVENDIKNIPIIVKLKSQWEKKKYYDTLLDELVKLYETTCRSNYIPHKQNLPDGDEHNEIYNFMPMIHEYCKDLLDKSLLIINSKNITNLTTDIEKSIKYTQGKSLPDIISYSTIESGCFPKIMNIKEYSLSTCEKIYGEFIKSLCDLFKNVHNYDDYNKNLINKILIVINRNLDIEYGKLIDNINLMFDMELERCYTINHYYSENIKKIKTLFASDITLCTIYGIAKYEDNKDKFNIYDDENENEIIFEIYKYYSNTTKSNEDYAIYECLIKIRSYLKVVIKRVIDYVALNIHHFIVNSLEKNMKDWLYVYDTIPDGKACITIKEIERILTPSIHDINKEECLNNKLDKVKIGIKLINDFNLMD